MADAKPTTDTKAIEPVPRFGTTAWLKAVNAAATKINDKALEGLQQTTTSNVNEDGKPKVSPTTTTTTTTVATPPAESSGMMINNVGSIRSEMARIAKQKEDDLAEIKKKAEEKNKANGGVSALIELSPTSVNAQTRRRAAPARTLRFD